MLAISSWTAWIWRSWRKNDLSRCLELLTSREGLESQKTWISSNRRVWNACFSWHYDCYHYSWHNNQHCLHCLLETMLRSVSVQHALGAHNEYRHRSKWIKIKALFLLQKSDNENLNYYYYYYYYSRHHHYHSYKLYL